MTSSSNQSQCHHENLLQFKNDIEDTTCALKVKFVLAFKYKKYFLQKQQKKNVNDNVKK